MQVLQGSLLGAVLCIPVTQGKKLDVLSIVAAEDRQIMMITKKKDLHKCIHVKTNETARLQKPRRLDGWTYRIHFTVRLRSVKMEFRQQ